MANTGHVQQLAKITGLDAESILTQVWPTLAEFKTPLELEKYLESFAGKSQESKTVINAIVHERFPSALLRGAFPPNQKTNSHKNNNTSQTRKQPERPLGPSPVPPPISTAHKPKSITVTDDEVYAAMSPAIRKQIKRINRTLRLMRIPRTDERISNARCFCRGREHGLSEYAKICPKCFLLICHLNPPTAPCPSCQFSPIIEPDDLETIKERQMTLKELLLDGERAKLLAQREIEEEERRKIKFPSLPGSNTSALAPQFSLSSNSRQSPKPQNSSRTVLSLDLKTKKVTQTSSTKAKVTKQNTTAAPTKYNALEEEEEEDKPYIDSEDLGYLKVNPGARQNHEHLFKVLQYIPSNQRESATSAHRLDDDDANDA